MLPLPSGVMSSMIYKNEWKWKTWFHKYTSNMRTNCWYVRFEILHKKTRSNGMSFEILKFSVTGVTAEWMGDIMPNSCKVNRIHSQHVCHKCQVKVVLSITIHFYQFHQTQGLYTSARCPHLKCFFRNRNITRQQLLIFLKEKKAISQHPVPHGHIIYSLTANKVLNPQKYSVLVSNNLNHFCWW